MYLCCSWLTFIFHGLCYLYLVRSCVTSLCEILLICGGYLPASNKQLEIKCYTLAIRACVCLIKLATTRHQETKAKHESKLLSEGLRWGRGRTDGHAQLGQLFISMLLEVNVNTRTFISNTRLGKWNFRSFTKFNSNCMIFSLQWLFNEIFYDLWQKTEEPNTKKEKKEKNKRELKLRS